MKKSWLFASAALLLGLTSAPGAGQVARSSDQWLPWLGCWRAEGDAAANFLCIVSEGAGVRLAQVADGAVKSESRIVADGVPRTVSQEGCAGQERASWSA
ncbi:MAG TPA: hypothetical protein VK864_03670, partial [Longimicrobiales bacterium]|nr:hypothetical protein [Longimicrobiales bacterium]